MLKLPVRMIILLLFITLSTSVLSQSDSEINVYKIKNIVSLTSEKGFIYIHTPKVGYLRGSYPEQFSVEISKLYRSQNTFNLYGCYIRRGFSFSYVNFDNPIVNGGYLAGYFIEPIYRLSQSLLFTLKGELGLSYLTNPNSLNNSQNLSYSTHINSNIRIGGGFSYYLTNKFVLSANSSFHHASNTAFNHPNLGINWITGSFSILYYPLGNKLPHYVRKKPDNWKNERIKKEISLFFCPAQSYYWTYQFKRNYVAGMDFELIKKVSDINEVTAGIEAYYNDITADQGTVYKNNTAAFQSGVLIGHRLLMNRFLFSQQLGFYLTSFPSYNSEIFFRLGIYYTLFPNWKVGINFKAHGKTADFLDFRLGYTF